MSARKRSGVKLDPAEFRRILLDPSSWEQTADALLSASRPLRGSVGDVLTEFRKNRFPEYVQWQTVQVYFMLCAYALENLFKARIVQVQRPAIEERLSTKPDDLIAGGVSAMACFCSSAWQSSGSYFPFASRHYIYPLEHPISMGSFSS